MTLKEELRAIAKEVIAASLPDEAVRRALAALPAARGKTAVSYTHLTWMQTRLLSPVRTLPPTAPGLASALAFL